MKKIVWMLSVVIIVCLFQNSTLAIPVTFSKSSVAPSATGESESLLINAKDVDGTIVQDVFIDLTSETINAPDEYSFISLNGGSNWSKIKSKSLSKVFGNKTLEICLAKKDESGKQDEDSVVKFEKIMPRPANAFKVNYTTDDTWVVLEKSSNLVLPIEFNQSGDDWNTVPIDGSELPAAKTKQKFKVRIPATFLPSITPASKTKVLTIMGKSKAPNFAINYKDEILKTKINAVIQISNQDPIIVQTKESVTVNVTDIIDNQGIISIYMNATGNKPASEIQYIFPAKRALFGESQVSFNKTKGVVTFSRSSQAFLQEKNNWGRFQTPKTPTNDVVTYKARTKTNISGKKSGLAHSDNVDVYIYYRSVNNKSIVEDVVVDVASTLATVTSISINQTDCSVEKTLSAKLNDTVGNAKVEYQWYRATDINGANAYPIQGATYSDYILTYADKTYYIFAKATGRVNTNVINQTSNIVGPIKKMQNIQYFSNGGIGNTVINSFDVDSTLNLIANPFSKSGYMFCGWSTYADGSNIVYSGGQEITMPDSTLSFYAVWASQSNGSDKTYSWYKSSTMYLNSASDLLGFFDILNGTALNIPQDSFAGKKVILNANVDISQVNFSQANKPFSGIFDGNSKVIYGLTFTGASDDYSGMFKSINGASLLNITLSGANVTSTGWTGILVGRADNSTITNCNVSGTANVSGTNTAIAGIVEYAKKCVITECQNNAVITVSNAQELSYSAGIVCESNNSKIEKCKNTANIIAGGKTGGYTLCYSAGIASYVKNGSTISYSENYGNISTECWSYVASGGITASVWVDDNAAPASENINNSKNFGKLCISGNDPYAGGIVGELYSYSGFNQTVSSCENSALIEIRSAATDVEGYGYVPAVGGIVGWGLDQNYTNLQNNLNSGELLSTGRPSDSGHECGSFYQ